MQLSPVEITDKAITEIKGIMANKNIPADYGLRIGVAGGGGCGGVKFILGFDKLKDGDLQYMVNDIPVYVEKKHTMYLLGMQVDFYEGADARGFTFINPQAKSSEAE